MVFELDEDVYDGGKSEEIELNCPWTITVPSGASHDFMITKLRWSFEHSFWLTAKIYPFDNSAQSITLDIKREKPAFAKLFITLSIYKKYPEPHLTQHDIQVPRELMALQTFKWESIQAFINKKKKIVQI